jgi:hypothetical protein
MTAFGRKRPFISVVFEQIERPLFGKADIEQMLWSAGRRLLFKYWIKIGADLWQIRAFRLAWARPP